MTFTTLASVALMPELGPAWPLAFVLADMVRDRKDDKLFPSIDHLCARTGFSRAQVKRHFATLRKLGILIDTGKRVGKTGRIHAYEFHVPPLAALRNKMKERLAQRSLPDDHDEPSNGLTAEPITVTGNGLTDEPINGVKWAHLPNGKGLICSSLMGSPVSHIHGKSTRLKHTGQERHSHAPLNTRAREVPPSASAASLPDDNNERERTKKAPTVQRSKKSALLSQGDALTPLEVRERTKSMASYLRALGVIKRTAVPAVIKQWAADPRVNIGMLAEAFTVYATDRDPNARESICEFASMVTGLLCARSVKRSKGDRS
ncbi:hypothetical protein AWB81_03760 [Caballeronia arationis]|uniref:Helix-turn-helix domain protein n=1 Tax=Caballeronia arationis TaxID=1777142 RepID=A0A7Z7IGF8_9BURK|nr:helix-turn-helix domain-containing protein [Caballeronia arationis]SAK77760.1 hypothetical protein AWB81_03760 [Caballeronia arationis]SOE88802.1 hypothetical protein SAMN05446927_7425 [Caballeronia arationis]